jgi:glycosyltransferase involved in cell wall biosynthesis
MNGYSKNEISFFKKEKMIVDQQERYIKNMVSVIITTYNRFESLLLAIESVKNQSYKNIEIIIINDCSTDERYYKTKFENCNVIHLSENSKTRFGYSCPGGYQRNFGMKIAQGEYIAFLDDDDYWMKNKIEIQLEFMKKTNIFFCVTNAYKGNGDYEEKKYNLFFEHGMDYNGLIKTYSFVNLFKNCNLIKDSTIDYSIIDKKILNLTNFCICSSVVLHKSIINKTGNFIITNKSEDYHYWLRTLQFQPYILIINKPLVYYNSNEGKQKSWSDNV